jgi:hypothetical protein
MSDKLMRVVCPSCDTVHELGSLVNGTDARQFVALLAELPAGVAKPALRYLQLFRSRGRATSWSRGLRLLGELLPMMKDGVVRRDGVAMDASAELWAEAMQDLAERKWARLPLTSNGYLLEVVMTNAQRAQVTTAEAALKARESQRRTGTTGEGVEVGGLLTQTGRASGGSPAVNDTAADKARANLMWCQRMLSTQIEDEKERDSILDVAAKAVAKLNPADQAVITWRAWLEERREAA